MSEEWLSVADIRAAQTQSSEEGLPDNHVVTIVERTLTVDIPELIQNNIKTDTVTLELDAEWDGISPVIIFECSDADYQVQYEGAATHIPQAVMKNTGSIGLSVCGYDDTGEIRLVTKAAPSTFTVVASGSFIGEISEDDVSLLGQILAAADAANAAANKVENASFAATATTLEPGESATAQITGDDLKMTVAFGIPKGETGEPGVAATIAVGTVTTGEPGTDAAVSNSGTAQAAVLDFTIPKGDAPVRGVDYWTAEDVEAVVEDAKAQAVAELAEIGNVPKRTVTDLVAHGEDAYAQKPIEVRIKGKTRQNLWVNPSGTQNGITVTSNDNGSITLSGTASAGATFFSEKLYVLRPDSTYTMSIDKPVAGFVDGCGIAIHYYDIDDTLLGSSAIGRTLTKATYEAPSNAAYAICRINFSTDATVSGTYRVMLNEGSTAQPWCPPGLSSVDELSVVTAGKNLADIHGYVKQSSDYYSADDNGRITVKATDIRTWSTVPLICTLPPGDYVANMSDNDGITYQLSINDVNKPNTTTATTFHLDVPSAIKVKFYNTGSANFSIELGSTATAYEPPNVTTTPLPEVELRSLPNGMCDELVIGADGTCRVERNLGQKTIDAEHPISVTSFRPASGTDLPYASLNNMFTPFDSLSHDITQTIISTSWPSIVTLKSRNVYRMWNSTIFVDERFTDAETAESIINEAGGTFVAQIPLSTEPQSPVTLPQLPAPTFNQYHDGDVPSDTSTTYARDINIVLSNLEAVQTALLGGEE